MRINLNFKLHLKLQSNFDQDLVSDFVFIIFANTIRIFNVLLVNLICDMTKSEHRVVKFVFSRK